MKSTQEMSRNKFTKFEVNNHTKRLKHFRNYFRHLNSCLYVYSVMNFLFQEELSLFLSDTIKASQVDRKMKRAEILRHTQTAESLWRKVMIYF